MNIIMFLFELTQGISFVKPTLTMKLHHGQLIELAIRRNGYSLTELARKLNVNRRTIYNWFQQPEIKPSVIISIGNILRHDFTKELPELSFTDGFTFNMVSKSPIINAPDDGWKNKYIELLEMHNKLLSQIVCENNSI